MVNDNTIDYEEILNLYDEDQKFSDEMEEMEMDKHGTYYVNWDIHHCDCTITGTPSMIYSHSFLFNDYDKALAFHTRIDYILRDIHAYRRMKMVELNTVVNEWIDNNE